MVTPLALIAILMLLIYPSAGTFLLSITDLILQGLWEILEQLAHLPFANIYFTPPEWYAIPLAMLAILILLAPKGFPARYLSLFLFFPLVFVQRAKPVTGTLWLTVLDVGQGLAIVIQTEQHSLVFDTGAKFGEDFDMGESVVIPYLHQQGISDIDTLVISHNDNDHSGGANAILANINVKQILSSASEWQNRFNANYCRAGQNWEWDEVSFKILSPPNENFEKENNNSCVLKIEGKHQSFILTGDIELGAENWLVAEYAYALHSKVLIAPHHGSKTYSSNPTI